MLNLNMLLLPSEELPGSCPQFAEMIMPDVPSSVSSEVIAAARWLQSETQRRAPVTEYFFWPRNDAWDEVKAAMETKPYISER